LGLSLAPFAWRHFHVCATRDPAIKAAKLEAKSAIVDVKENTADVIKTLKTVMNNDRAPSAARVERQLRSSIEAGEGQRKQSMRT
jgi:hypothetical protein